MKKERILEELHRGLQQTVESMELTEDGLRVAEEDVSNYMTALRSVSKLKFPVKEKEEEIQGSTVHTVEVCERIHAVEAITEHEEPVEKKEPEEKEEQKEKDIRIGLASVIEKTEHKEESSFEVDKDERGRYFLNGERVFKFERQKCGGTLEGKDAFVPEALIRAIGIEHGDYLFAEENGNLPDGKPRYSYTLAKRGKGIPRKGSRVLKRVKVKYDETVCRHYVDEDRMGRTLRIDEVPYSFYLQPYDVQMKEVEVGDTIDLAYDVQKPNEAVVQWKYTVVPSDDAEKTVVVPEEKEKTETPQTLTGKCVVVVGMEPKKAEMREEVEKRGGTFRWVHGKRGDVATTESAVKNADVLVLYLNHIGHGGSGKGSIGIVEMAKEYGVSFETLHTYGKVSFVRTVHEMVGKVV